MTSTVAIKERAPLTKELRTCWCRWSGRPGGPDGCVHDPRRGTQRRDRRRTFFANTAPRRYSLEIDLPGSVAILDIDAAHRIMALHLLESID